MVGVGRVGVQGHRGRLEGAGERMEVKWTINGGLDLSGTPFTAYPL